MRNRARFASQGVLVAVVDTPSDHPGGLDGFRTSAAHADDIRAVIAALKQEAAVPVWLVGTSHCQGQDCAESIARRLAPLLGWSGRRIDAELEAFQAHVARSHRFRA